MATPVIPSFCQTCGGALRETLSQAGEGPPFICTSCGRAVYLDPKLAVAAVVTTENQGVVLLRRAQRDKAYGKWILPGGHVDRGEEVTKAALREVKEETGLSVRLDGPLRVYSYESNPTVLIAYAATATSGELIMSPEALEIKVFPFDLIPWDELGYLSTRQALKDLLPVSCL
ncbi:NUDIX hydrolase [Dethiosulfatarculus sandiegensis]|uniref:NUDIX hydrolase n=1 Tax=Dethiosulfatarculus sandiegensis TaxID=1429043 RepID=A0A0D2HST3_9BACT|nr:NUDIX domain-containing protein [Dethiosulfatarculus sandiegensis]KIX13583.1 NUDIX hydrolase [Dethiosulfatarculus sandiegensis]